MNGNKKIMRAMYGAPVWADLLLTDNFSAYGRLRDFYLWSPFTYCSSKLFLILGWDSFLNGLKYSLHTCGKGWLAIAFSFKSNIKTIIVNFATIFHRILTIKIGVLVEIKGVIIVLLFA